MNGTCAAVDESKCCFRDAPSYTSLSRLVSPMDGLRDLSVLVGFSSHIRCMARESKALRSKQTFASSLCACAVRHCNLRLHWSIHGQRTVHDHLALVRRLHLSAHVGGHDPFSLYTHTPVAAICTASFTRARSRSSCRRHRPRAARRSRCCSCSSRASRSRTLQCDECVATSRGSTSRSLRYTCRCCSWRRHPRASSRCVCYCEEPLLLCVLSRD